MYNYVHCGDDQVDYIEVGASGELPPGERLFVEIDSQAIVIFNLAGILYAIADLCSHDDGPLGDGELERFEVICPRHGARFDLRTGKVLSLPAVVDIPAYPVRVRDSHIEVGLPRD